jgi:hypothetical protein
MFWSAALLRRFSSAHESREQAKILETENPFCFPSCVSWASRLSISRTRIHYHHTLHRIIQPVRDRVVTDDFDLPDLERGVLIAIVAFSPRPVTQAVNEFHDLLSLTATLGNRFEQINIQINLVGFHRRLFGI